MRFIDDPAYKSSGKIPIVNDPLRAPLLTIIVADREFNDPGDSLGTNGSFQCIVQFHWKIVISMKLIYAGWMFHGCLRWNVLKY